MKDTQLILHNFELITHDIDHVSFHIVHNSIPEHPHFYLLMVQQSIPFTALALPIPLPIRLFNLLSVFGITCKDTFCVLSNVWVNNVNQLLCSVVIFKICVETFCQLCDLVLPPVVRFFTTATVAPSVV